MGSNPQLSGGDNGKTYISRSRSVTENLPATTSSIDLTNPTSVSSAATNREVERLETRILELESKLREMEEELEFYFNFFKKTKRAGTSVKTSKTVTSSSGELKLSAREDSPDGDSKSGGPREHKGSQASGSFENTGSELSDSDSDLEDGVVSGNVNYAGEFNFHQGDGTY